MERADSENNPRRGASMWWIRQSALAHHRAAYENGRGYQTVGVVDGDASCPRLRRRVEGIQQFVRRYSVGRGGNQSISDGEIGMREYTVWMPSKSYSNVPSP